MANRVSPKNRPWARKTVLLPNPLFLSIHSSSQPQQQQFYKTRSPIISRNKGTTSHKIASRLVSLSPLRTKKTVQKNDGFVSGNSNQHQHCNSSLFEEFKKNLEFVAIKFEFQLYLKSSPVQ
ncbi:putative microtubule-binding protein TANGLED, partial [Mucuna pruriens]